MSHLPDFLPNKSKNSCEGKMSRAYLEHLRDAASHKGRSIKSLRKAQRCVKPSGCQRTMAIWEVFEPRLNAIERNRMNDYANIVAQRLLEPDSLDFNFDLSLEVFNILLKNIEGPKETIEDAERR